MSKLDNSAVSTHLGKVTGYISTYTPSLLVRELRQNNRTHLGIIEGEPLPFVGYDEWHAYELSFLNEKGVPITCLGKILYPCTSKYIVESKSIKLYLNSFNMEKIPGKNISECIQLFENIVRADLSKLLETNVSVFFFETNNCSPFEYDFPHSPKYLTLESSRHFNLGKIKHYTETPSLLECEYIGLRLDKRVLNTSYHLKSSLLKSNCRVTSQPDWGDVYITYTPNKHVINKESLLRYIISFRDECHFHEEITETIYTRLWDKFKPRELCVACLYVRRGGIDINPVRASSDKLIPAVFKDVKLIEKTQRQ